MLILSPLYLTVSVTFHFYTDRERTGKVGGTDLKGAEEPNWVKAIKNTTNRGISCRATNTETCGTQAIFAN